MSTTTKSTARSIVALNLEKPVPALITQATNFVTRMTGNPYFPTPTPNLALIATAIGTLQTAEAGAVSRIKGAAAERNQKRKELVALLEQLRTYVQTVADADEGNAPAIIESAGFSLRKKPTHKPRVFSAKPGPQLRRGGGHRRVGGSPRLVRLAVQHRRRQDVGRAAVVAEGQDDRHGPHAGSGRAVQVPDGDQVRHGRLEPAGVAHDSVSVTRIG